MTLHAEWFGCESAADVDGVVGRIRSLVPPAASVREAVADILATVADRGDAAVMEMEARFGGTGQDLRVTQAELEQALSELDDDVRDGLRVAITNVATVARAGLGQEQDVVLAQGQRVRLREVPVRRAGVYAPGGRAPYPSSVIMGAVTARVAGVEKVVVCAPAHPVILAACALCEVDEVLRMGGAQAIGALAYGTESVRPVDVIVGPGNLWVQEAKRQVSGLVGIDGFAGPSDLLIVLSEGADLGLAALDLLAQGEHGADTPIVAVSHDERLLDDLGVEVGGRLAARTTVADAKLALVHTDSLETSLAVSEAFAPEHLELLGEDAEALAPRVRNAGCLFVGRGAGTAFGDYVAGSNHTLPTEGAARFASGLSTRHFTRRMAEVRLDDAAVAALAPHGAAIARAEGFLVHAESMTARVRPTEEDSP